MDDDELYAGAHRREGINNAGMNVEAAYFHGDQRRIVLERNISNIYLECMLRVGVITYYCVITNFQGHQP